MGFDHGARQRRPSSDDTGPVITLREYTVMFTGALRLVTGDFDTDSYRPRATDGAAAARRRVAELSRRVQQHPTDPVVHRMLAVAHLHAGDCKSAVRHLEIAVNILCAQAGEGCLHRTLAARLELALLVPAIVPLCARLGKQELVRRLIGEVLSAWQ